MNAATIAFDFSVNISKCGASLMLNGARLRPPKIWILARGRRQEMSKAKLAAFAAALVLAVSSQASAQSSQAALKAPPQITKSKLVAWCKSHPSATADCKEVRADNREIRSDRKEIRADRREVKADIKAGDKKEARQDAKEVKSDRKDLRQDRRDRRGDVRDIRKNAPNR
jgi:hypothetical protein